MSTAFRLIWYIYRYDNHRRIVYACVHVHHIRQPGHSIGPLGVGIGNDQTILREERTRIHKRCTSDCRNNDVSSSSSSYDQGASATVLDPHVSPSCVGPTRQNHTTYTAAICSCT